MAQSLWIPYLTDNIYRLTGLGTHADITQLRQAVRKIDSGQRVGIKPTVPFSALLGDAELANLPNILQQVSSDPVKHLCHKLMWFPLTNISDDQAQDINEIRLVIQSTFSATQIEYLHSSFVLELLLFLKSGKTTHLRNCIDNLHEFYSHKGFDGYADHLVEQMRQGTSGKVAGVLEEAKVAIAVNILNFAVDTSLESLSNGAFARGRSILKVVVESPLEDDWEDAVLTRVDQYVSTILSTIQETTRLVESWSPNFIDPISKECAQVESLANLLRGRVLAVREWDITLQQWKDKKAILMCNYAVESVNELTKMIEETTSISPHNINQLMKKLYLRLQNAEMLIQQALQMKVSEQTRQHLNKMLNEIRELKSTFSHFQDELAIKICKQSIDSLNYLINVLNDSHHLHHHQELHLLRELQSRLETIERQILGALEMDISEPVRHQLLQILEKVRAQKLFTNISVICTKEDFHTPRETRVRVNNRSTTSLRVQEPEKEQVSSQQSMPNVSMVDYILAPFESCVAEIVKRIIFAFFLILIAGLISLISSLLESCSK